MEYKYLTNEIKEMLVKAAEEIDIDYDELETYEYHAATSPYSYYGPEPAYDEYDEDEYLAKQYLKLADYCREDGFWEFIDVDYDEDNEEKMKEMNEECVDYLETIADQTYRYYCV